MSLSSADHQRFRKLWGGLIRFGLGKNADTVFEQHDQEALVAARDSVFQNRRQITAFVKKNPFGLTPEELEN